MNIQYLPPDQRKKILLLCDDLRMTSGIATMARSFVLGTAHRYKWFQVGAAVNHPEKEKLIDVSESVNNEIGITDSWVKILPWNGYGNPDLIRNLLITERPDAILHFTDPRYWTWLYEIEGEIRKHVPILYYSIWDDLPDPQYNRNYYESCDWIGCISKQTYGIVKRLTSSNSKPSREVFDEWRVKYVPHGIDSKVFKPTEVPKEFVESIFGKPNKPDFVFLWSNRNIRRKKPADVIMAFKEFVSNLDHTKGITGDNVCLVLHTQPMDQAGTDLIKLVADLCPELNIKFSTKKLSPAELNYLYNLADCTINIAGNEGFGLTTAESVMAGTPIMVNVTGGLQDQCGFKLNGRLLTDLDYVEIGSLHDIHTWKDRDGLTWGEWSFPIWSRAKTLAGSIPTPYIWDDVVDIKDVSTKMMEVLELGRDEMKRRGEIGRETFISDLNLSRGYMCEMLSEGIDDVIHTHWVPRELINIYTV